MNTVIFGANGPTGRLLVEIALEAGHSVTAAVRNPDAFDLPGATVVRADVLDAASTADAIEGADAVLSSLGVPFVRTPIETYSRGTANIIAGMKEHGVRRLLLTSSSAADPAVRFKNSGGGPLIEALKPLVIFGFGRSTYRDMRRMESLVTESSLDWTIVRPSGLFNTDVTSDFAVEQDHVRGAFTSRRDLATFMVRGLDSAEWIGRVAAVSTREGVPKVLEFFRAEALK